MRLSRIRSHLLKLPMTPRYLAAKIRWLATMGRKHPQLEPIPPTPGLAWYRTTLVQSVDLFNGGLDGRSGLGSYCDDFNGYFHAALDRRWLQLPLLFSTSVTQSRAIYINAEAARHADDNTRFLKAIRQGVDYLLSAFRDTQYGGFFRQMTPKGTVRDTAKDGYGNVHPFFALAEAYSVTRDPRDLQAALDQLGVIVTYFWDMNFPGGVHTSRSRDFSTSSGVHNINTVIHLFEALLSLYDVCEGETRQRVADLITRQGNFITQHLYRDQTGYTDRGYLAFYYDAHWQPSQITYNRQTRWINAGYATLGHAIEAAYLLSRAVERGFDTHWLTTADKMIRFCLAYGLDPVYGGMIHEITNYEGQPLPLQSNTFISWAQLETARALLHFSIVRAGNYQVEFQRVETLYRQHFLDPVYGGHYEVLEADGQLKPTHTDKAHLWLMNYHHAMFLGEILRLAAICPQANMIIPR